MNITEWTSIINLPGFYYREKDQSVKNYEDFIDGCLEHSSPEDLLRYSQEYSKVNPLVSEAVILWCYAPPRELVEGLYNAHEAEGWQPIREALEDDKVEAFYYGGYIPVVGLPGTRPDTSLMEEVQEAVLEAIKKEKLDRESYQQAQRKSALLKEEFFFNLKPGNQLTYLSHDAEGIKFQMGDRVVTIGAGASMVDYDECEGFITYQVEEA